MTTTSCIASQGKKIIGKDDQSQRFIDRMNKVDALFCDMTRRIRVEDSILSRYCPGSPVSSSESASLSECCPLDKCPTTPEISHLINVTDLDEDAYDLLEMLEQEVCATLALLVEFESLNDDCTPPDVSDSISKSDSDSLSKSKSDSISTSISVSISLSNSESDSISTSISKSNSDSDSLSKSISDSISDSDSLSKSKSDSDSDSLSNLEPSCDFVLLGGSWGGLAPDFSTWFTNAGPDPVEVISATVLPFGSIVSSITMPFILDAGPLMAAFTISSTATPIVGIIYHTTCGDYMQPFASADGAPLIKLP